MSVDLKKLEATLSSNTYVSGSDLPSAEDATTFSALKQMPCKREYPNVWAWYVFINCYTPAVRESWGASGSTPKPAAAAAKPAAAKPAEKKPAEKAKGGDDDDDFDLFGETSAEDAAAAKELAEKKKAEAAAKKKPAVVGKSLVLLDIKPWEAEQDLEALATKVKTIAMEGLDWKQQHKLIPIAFGVKKLQVGCVVVDDLVGVDDLIDRIQNDYADEVQSIDIFSFGKI
eukprot:GILK01000232.1.p1 GENE.GILK01000232.1~~GILK01000232.1.p1  ORF type:complete len:229 (+),score=67.83 GILK01000232.1:40-726(+)